jgi:hypothetical protein
MRTKRAPYNDLCNIYTGPLTIPSFQYQETVPCRFVIDDVFTFADSPFVAKTAYFTMDPVFLRGWQWGQFGSIWIGDPRQAFMLQRLSHPLPWYRIMFLELAVEVDPGDYIRVYVEENPYHPIISGSV